MKLFYSPGACSLGIHLLLEEAGAPYETQKVNLADNEQTRPPFIDMNPKGKVPVLELDDGTILTEFPVIAQWLGQQHGMLPPDGAGSLRAAEAMAYCVGTIHAQGFTRMFRPANFALTEADHDATRARGRSLLGRHFDVLSAALGDRPFIGGDAFTVADAALFYVEYWAVKRASVPVPANVQAHFDRVAARPAAARALAAEGLAA